MELLHSLLSHSLGGGGRCGVYRKFLGDLVSTPEPFGITENIKRLPDKGESGEAVNPLGSHVQPLNFSCQLLPQ